MLHTWGMSIPHQWRRGKTLNLGVFFFDKWQLRIAIPVLLKGGKHGGWWLQMVPEFIFCYTWVLFGSLEWFSEGMGWMGLLVVWLPVEWPFTWIGNDDSICSVHSVIFAVNQLSERYLWNASIPSSFQWSKCSINASWFLSMLECQLGLVGMLTLLPSYLCMAWILVLFLQINFLVSMPYLRGCGYWISACWRVWTRLCGLVLVFRSSDYGRITKHQKVTNLLVESGREWSQSV